jgi:hypothetical protein
VTRVLTLIILTLFAGVASADEDDDDDDGKGGGPSVSFGVTPWFHMGPAWTTWAGDPAGTVRRGVSIELTGQALMVLPGQRIGLGVAAGYLGVGGNLTDGTGEQVNLTGFQAMPLVMISLLSRLSIHLKGGYVFGAANDTEIGAGAVRFGGGLTVVILRIYSSDVALSADVMHTRIVTADPGTPVLGFASTSGQLGISVAFNPDIIFGDDD